VVDDVDSSGIITKSTYDIKMLFDKINMMWMNRRIHRHAFTTAFDDQDLRMQLESWDDSRHLTRPLTIDSGCRHVLHVVSDTIHMMWMGRTIHHHAVTTIHDDPIWGVT
jgi:hypothetical protein